MYVFMHVCMHVCVYVYHHATFKDIELENQKIVFLEQANAQLKRTINVYVCMYVCTIYACVCIYIYIYIYIYIAFLEQANAQLT